MGALVGQVLKYNGSTWVPSNMTSSQLYRGIWNASSGVAPDFGETAAVAGDYYVVDAGGTYLTITYAVGDWAIYNGTSWEKISASTNLVSSFKGRMGVVVPAVGDYSMSQLSDIDFTVLSLSAKTIDQAHAILYDFWEELTP